VLVGTLCGAVATAIAHRGKPAGEAA